MPESARLRDRLHHSLRAAVLASKEPDLLSTWTRSSWGADDYDLWLAQRDALSISSPMRSLVDGQLARLDRDLA